MEKDWKALPLVAKLNLKTEGEDKKAELPKKIAEELDGTEITLTVDPVTIWGALLYYEASLPRKLASLP